MFLVPNLLYNYLCPSVCPSLKCFATYGCCHPCLYHNEINFLKINQCYVCMYAIENIFVRKTTKEKSRNQVDKPIL